MGVDYLHVQLTSQCLNYCFLSQQKKKKRRDLDHKTVDNDITVKENGHNGNDDCKRVITGDDDDEMNEEDFEDYRKEEQAVEESGDEKDDSSDIDDDQKKASSGIGQFKLIAFVTEKIIIKLI